MICSCNTRITRRSYIIRTQTGLQERVAELRPNFMVEPKQIWIMFEPGELNPQSQVSLDRTRAREPQDANMVIAIGQGTGITATRTRS